MIDSACDNIIGAQNNHLKGQRWQKATNVHCHCLPGNNSIPGIMAESLAICRQLIREGITAAVPISLMTNAYNIKIHKSWIRAAFVHMGTRLSKQDIAHIVYIENPTIFVKGHDVVPVYLSDQQETGR